MQSQELNPDPEYALRTLKDDDIDYYGEKHNFKITNVAWNHKNRKQADLQPGMA